MAAPVIRITPAGEELVKSGQPGDLARGIEVHVLVAVCGKPMTILELMQKVRKISGTYKFFGTTTFAVAVSNLKLRGLVTYG